MLKLRTCKTYAEAISEAASCAAAFGKDLHRRMYAFCEDKLTMSLETAIAAASGGGTFNVRVTTFSRFIHACSEKERTILDKESSVMAVKSILLKLGPSLKCFKRSAGNAGTAVTLYELIAQLKSANVRPSDLTACLGGMGGALERKVKDIAAVYEAYEEYISERGLFDSNSYLALMPQIISGGEFGGCSAMLVGFGSLTRQGVDVAKALAEHMENLYVFTLDGANKELYTGELKELIMREIGGFCLEESDVRYCKEREKIMDTLFDPRAFSAPRTETDRIFAYEAVDAEDEIGHIAAIIRREAVGGTRYRDMAVAIGMPASYSEIISRVFGDYGIPYFLDDPKKLSAHPIARLAVAYIDLLRNGVTRDGAIALEKNPYFQPDKGISDRFEQYALKNAITSRAMKNGLNLTKTPIEELGEDYELFERERLRICALYRSAHTAGEFTGLIREMLEGCGAERSAEENAERLSSVGAGMEAAFTAQAYGKVMEVLGRTESVLGDADMTAAEFRGVLVSGLNSCEISVIPQLGDAVYVGDYKECKYLEHKILFAAGLNGDVPFTKSDTALLNDRDLNKLEKFDCIVEPKIKIVNRRERENVGAALVSFSERLYISRASVGADGMPAPKGRVPEYFYAVFTKGGKPLFATSPSELKRRSANSPEFMRALASVEYSALRPGTARFLAGAADFKEGKKNDFSAETAFITALRRVLPDEAEKVEELLRASDSGVAKPLELAGKLILKRDTLSASVLETYFSCPFSCFMRYALRCKESEDGEVKRNEYGTFLHSVLENFVIALKADYAGSERKIQNKGDVENIVDGLFEKLTGEYRYARYLESDDMRTMFGLVRREARRVALAIYSGFENSRFRPSATEVTFSDNGSYPPIGIDTPLGKKKLSGIVDRVDRYGDYLRVIDYKTGKIHGDDEEFYTGTALQLYLYMNALLGGGVKPAGAYYFPVSDKFSAEDERDYAMTGKTVDDPDIILATDSALDGVTLSSDALGCNFKYVEGKPRPSSSKDSFLSEGDFSAYLSYALLIARQGASEIAEGIIAPSPYGEKCKYCEYKAACDFDGDIDSPRREKDKKQMREAIKSAAEVKDDTD